jgi:hypothetical protein
MTDHDADVSVFSRAGGLKPMKAYGIGPVARPLLLVVLMAGSSVACVIPPPGDFAEGDAGPSSPPVLMSVSPPEFAPPVMVVEPDDQRRLGLTLRDIDVDDTLFVRIYIDYGVTAENPAVASCTAVPSSEQIRIADCSAANLCNTIPDTEEHLLEVMIADLDYLDEGEPAFRALPETAASSIRGWKMRCNQ